jgi:hypothetical protein
VTFLPLSRKQLGNPGLVADMPSRR